MAEKIAFTPRGMSRTEAARYIGVGPTLFDQLVKDGRMPPPKRINARTIWDRHALDEFFDALPGGAVVNDWDWMDD